MDEIDSRLRVRNPAAQVDGTVNPASLASLSLPGSDRDRSQALMNLSTSQFSQLDAMSSASRRSNFTLITLKSQQTNLSGKSRALPKEGRLRENALRRMNDAQIKEIENHLRRIRNTTDLSYSNAKQVNPDQESKSAAEDGETTDRKLVDQETLMRLIDEAKEE